MLERLTNPLISLHEAGVILNLCASTLRRYSDSGVLPHERTAGGQRRFRLKQVLVLLQDREKQRLHTRRRNRGRIRSSPRIETRKTGAPASPQAPVLSEREQREIEARKVLEAARASVKARPSQAAVQKSQARDTPPSRIPISRLASLGRAQMLADEAEHKAYKDDD